MCLVLTRTTTWLAGSDVHCRSACAPDSSAGELTGSAQPVVVTVQPLRRSSSTLWTHSEMTLLGSRRPRIPERAAPTNMSSPLSTYNAGRTNGKAPSVIANAATRRSARRARQASLSRTTKPFASRFASISTGLFTASRSQSRDEGPGEDRRHIGPMRAVSDEADWVGARVGRTAHLTPSLSPVAGAVGSGRSRYAVNSMRTSCQSRALVRIPAGGRACSP